MSKAAGTSVVVRAWHASGRLQGLICWVVFAYGGVGAAVMDGALAGSPAEIGGSVAVGDRERQLVIFQLAREIYGLDINWVREIITLQEITRVPGAPDFVEGVINLRGHVIPVIDLRKRFGLEASVDPRRTRIVVVDVPPHTLGLVVDAVTEVLRIAESVVEPAGNILAGIDLIRRLERAQA